ncbi:mariner Mos1 transposase [Trichonephila clavipes]|uniref:Mariner Mos1 transposase n=1 Tax=Trichonephila clavipes TaxID=2585209 RepID=A0A8X7BMD7_TRICX|nr:mariner Mos1 transposase [Trichonephila clavipes]
MCIWWDWKGIIYYKLLPYSQTLNSDIYCRQLDHLRLAIDQKRPKLDGTDETQQRKRCVPSGQRRSHTSLVTRQNLCVLGWEVLMHAPYSPDLASSNYYLFSQCKTSRMKRNWDREKIVKIDY